MKKDKVLDKLMASLERQLERQKEWVKKYLDRPSRETVAAHSSNEVKR